MKSSKSSQPLKCLLKQTFSKRSTSRFFGILFKTCFKNSYFDKNSNYLLLDFLEIFPYWFCISAQNNKFSIAVFFSKCYQICSFLCNGKHHFLCSASSTFIISFFEDWSEKLFFLTSYDFDSWTFKKIKTLKIQKHSVSAH